MAWHENPMTTPQHLLFPWGVGVLALFALLWWGWRLGGRAAEVDWGGPWINRIDGLGRLFCRRYHRLQGGPLYLPESGPAIVVANHISGLDPFLLITASRRRLRFIIASEQYHRFGFNWLFRAAGCIPVDRQGRPERAFRAALKALAEGEVVALFPHGTIHLEGDPHRRLKPGAVRLAQLAGCPIFPVRIDGVRAAGGIFLPVVLRGRATIENFPPIDCSGRPPADCLAVLERVLVKGPTNG
ncbi:MAG: 1-acyl-sn-glycerol-3-phosphate acyltransferase [Gammaproteobacteria bacterium]|nr:1-acyl-sn-glycerol-3-phosphate acyltransferase [Gammaproteobacteria bacterium]